MKKKIQAEMNLVISKEVENVQDAVAKFDESNIEEIYLEFKLVNGEIHKFKVDDHFVKWINEYRDGEELPL